MRIGLDIDGVIYKWQKTAAYMLRDVLPNSPYKEALVNAEERWTCWNWPIEVAGVSKEHWNWLWTEGVRLGLFRYGHLYPGSIQAVRRLAELGHEVVLITHRPKQAVGDTLAWLGLMNLPISGLFLLTNQENKASVHPQCDAYLDDKPENCMDLRQGTQARIVALCDQPWNRDVNALMMDCVRVRGWDEFINLVEMNK